MDNLIQNLYNLDNKVAYICLKELERISCTSNAKWDIDNKINSIEKIF